MDAPRCSSGCGWPARPLGPESPAEHQSLLRISVGTAKKIGSSVILLLKPIPGVVVLKLFREYLLQMEAVNIFLRPFAWQVNVFASVYPLKMSTMNLGANLTVNFSEAQIPACPRLCFWSRCWRVTGPWCDTVLPR